MSYAKEGFPVEAASKIGQLRIINDPFLQGLIQSFESPNNHDSSPLVNPSGNLDLSKKSQIQRILQLMEAKQYYLTH